MQRKYRVRVKGGLNRKYQVATPKQCRVALKISLHNTLV